MSIDLSALPQRVSVALGASAEFGLPSYAGSGNYWSAICLEGETVAQVTVELGPPEDPRSPAGDVTTGPPTPTLVPERVVIHGQAAGVAHWQLQLARRFGDQSPVAVHDLEVVVSD